MSQTPDHICEEETFQEVFRKNALHLRNFMRYKGAEEEQARDLVQEAFLRLWKACRQISITKAKSYLFTTANRLLIDAQRHQKYVREYENLPHQEAASPDPERILEAKELKERVRRTIAELPEKQRIVFLMNRVDHLTYREIAGRLGISVKAVEKRMHKALEALRACL